ncbi:NAD-dependent epimerase/dehydratase family protein [Streptomyces sp. NPDC085946]|uniref:NAD-dependent epimerase/dehydratase family protein n=1 Tax=Streptomyces sp. NPDC085946 TaxID=3365744 RepID=UPI0037D4EB1B
MMPTTTFTGVPAAPPPWRRALVTGGAGFLGSHLCERLLGSGAEVDCLDDLSTGHADNIGALTGRAGFRFLELDVADPGCADALPGPYDLVLHLAGPASPYDGLRRPLRTLDTGSLGTRNALAVADRDGARFLLASAPRHDDEPRLPPEPVQRADDDADPLAPRSAYAEWLRFSEALVAAHAGTRGSNAGIVRLFAPYGPRMRTDDGRLIPAFVRQALAGRPLTVAGDGSRPCRPCYVDDAVEGVLLVAAGRSVRPVDLGADEEVAVAEIARRVIELTGSGSRLEFAGPPVPPAEPYRPDTGFARELFGWVPRVAWQDGLERTVAALTGGCGHVPAAVTGPGRGEWLP